MILEAQEVTKIHFAGSAVFAVNKVSLAVRAGEFVVIHGPSGCGKSTLLTLLGGLDRPNRGEVFLDGQPYSALSQDGLARLRRNRIGFVFQFFNLLDDLRAAENVALPLRLAGRSQGETAARVAELLEAVGMSHRGHHFPYELSGGEQQRVAVARALAASPAVILADEPTGNLDTKSSRDVMELFRRFNRETGQTFVVVSHDPQFAHYADRVVRMEDGQISGIEVKAG